jgi:hypothetical protein
MLRILGSPSGVKKPGAAGASLGRAIHRAGPVLVTPLEEEPFIRLLWGRSGKALRRSRKQIRRRWTFSKKASVRLRKKARGRWAAFSKQRRRARTLKRKRERHHG